MSSELLRYRFDGNLDSDNPAAVGGTTVGTSYGTGRYGLALGTMYVGHKATLAATSICDDYFGQTGGNYLSCWVFIRRDITIPGFAWLLSKDTWDLGFINNLAGNKKSISFGHDFSGNNGQWGRVTADVPTDEWFHMTIAYDNSSASNDPQFFVNGVLIANNDVGVPTGTRLSDAGNSMIIGDIGSVRSTWKIDDLRLYSGLDLTTQELANLYNLHRTAAAGSKGMSDTITTHPHISGLQAREQRQKGRSSFLVPESSQVKHDSQVGFGINGR